MILYIQHLNGDRQFFRLNKPEDFEPIFDLFPRTKDLAMFASTLEEAANKIAKYLSTHSMNAWVENGDLAKGLKEIAAALGIAGAAISPTAMSTTQHETPPIVQHKYPSKPFGTQPEDSFLWTVSQIESSGGKNTAHKPVQAGAYKGQTAVGKWGFLPSTVQEMVKRHRNIGKLTPQIEDLETMTRDELDKKFKRDPNIELELARFAARHVLRRQRGDVHRAAYAWNMGHNLFPSQISDQDMSGHDYVEKFKMYDQNNPVKIKKLKPRRSNVTLVQNNVLKAEDQGTFKIRLAVWKSKRQQELREPAPRDHTYTPDPGRIRKEPDDTRSVVSKIIERNKK